MGVYEKYFPLGLGTSRFPISGPDDTKGIDKSVELVCCALDAGINYIDTSYTYSAGMAQSVLREAFSQVKRPVGVTVKVMHDMDKTADDARRRVELQLNAMGLDKADFFTCWCISGYSQFKEIIKKGGVYDGALRMKKEGVIKHICFSSHAQPTDIIKIIESGAFEGVTLSYNLTNAAIMQPVLEAAYAHGVDVAVMNPLGGGIIAQNPDFFGFARGKGDEDVIGAAMRFVKAPPAVKIVLSGIADKEEIGENIGAVLNYSEETDSNRHRRVITNIGELDSFCTGCNYCDGCPVNIPTAEIMRKRNALLFSQTQTYNRADPELVKNINLFHSHMSTNDWFPDTSENPCIQCGQCEKKCTQKLDIMNSLADTFDRAGKVGFSLQARKTRLNDLLFNKGYKRVGLYPNGGFANMLVELYDRFFGDPDFEWLQFNSDPKMWGQSTGGLPIHAPDEIKELNPDIVVVCTYKYDQEIFASLDHYEDEGIKIAKLHKETDVPWVY